MNTNEPCPYCGGSSTMHRWTNSGPCPLGPDPPIYLTGSIEISALKALCSRAADALEKWNKLSGNSVRDLHVFDLIAELRKAAE